MKSSSTTIGYIALADASGSARREGGRPRRPGPAPRRSLTSARRIAAGAAIGLVTLALLAATAQARGSVYLPSPSYPNSSLAIKALGKPRAGGIVKVVVSGSNAPFEAGFPGSGDYISYQLEAFAQNGNVLPNCPRSFAEELQNEINLGVARIAQGLNEGFYGPFAIPIRFRTAPRVRRVVVCAYSRLIDDDAAVSALGFKLRRGRG
jgi:hypothetical protein